MDHTDRQLVIDRLAARLGLPVVLEDTGQQPLAHSPHHGLADGMRRDTILRHATSQEVVERFRPYRLAERTEPFLTAGEGDEQLPRWCVPLRQDARTLGFLWVLLPAAEVSSTTRELTAEAAAALTRSLAAEDRVRRAEATTVVDLLLGDTESRLAALTDLHTRGRIGEGRRVAVAVCTGPAWRRSAVRTSFWQAGWAPPGGDHLRAVTEVEGISIFTVTEGVQAEEVFTPPLERLRLVAEDEGLVVGVGTAVAGPGEAHHSHRQARQAARVARTRAGRRVVDWATLGVERYLTALPHEALAAAVDPRVRRLVAEAPLLAATAERYLAEAGAIAPVAAALHIHRTTLYHRLDGVRRVGLDLGTGEDRTVTDVGLRAMRLLGEYPGDHLGVATGAGTGDATTGAGTVAATGAGTDAATGDAGTP